MWDDAVRVHRGKDFMVTCEPEELVEWTDLGETKSSANSGNEKSCAGSVGWRVR